MSSKCLLLISHPVYGTLSQQPEVTVAGWKSELRVSEAQPGTQLLWGAHMGLHRAAPAVLIYSRMGTIPMALWVGEQR